MAFVKWPTVPATSYPFGPWVIYALVDPRDETVRYVGVTSAELSVRRLRHMMDPVNWRMGAWTRELRAAGIWPDIRPLIAVTQRWEHAERGWIAWFRARGELLNVDPGGVCRKAGGEPINRRPSPAPSPPMFRPSAWDPEPWPWRPTRIKKPSAGRSR